MHRASGLRNHPEPEARAGLPSAADLIVEDEPELTCIHRTKDGQHVYLLVNTSDHEICRPASVAAAGETLLWLDPDSGSVETLAGTAENGRTVFELKLAPLTARALVIE